MSHCEIYCTAQCCEKGAFEIHSALLLRKAIDENISGNDGSRLLRNAREQLKGIKEKINSGNYDVVKQQIPVWHRLGNDLPDYWLEEEGINSWFEKWSQAFNEAVTGVIPDHD